jgi:hypothetical protein
MIEGAYVIEGRRRSLKEPESDPQMTQMGADGEDKKTRHRGTEAHWDERLRRFLYWGRRRVEKGGTDAGLRLELHYSGSSTWSLGG